MKTTTKKAQAAPQPVEQPMNMDQVYNDLINTSQAVAMLAERAVAADPNDPLAQHALQLVDRVDALNEWVSTGRPLPGQMKEIHEEVAQIAHVAQLLNATFHLGRSAAFSHSFSPDFYEAMEDEIVDLRKNDREYFDLMLADVFGDDYAEVWKGKDYLGETVPMDIINKARETDTVSDLRSPVEVWIDEDGYYTIDVP